MTDRQPHPRILVFAGSRRTGSHNKALARLAAERIERLTGSHLIADARE